jgi:hypothetical protein
VSNTDKITNINTPSFASTAKAGSIRPSVLPMRAW